MNPNDIIIGERLRPLNAERVAELERSIAAIGLETPITIRHTEGKPILVAGAHRLQAVKNLGWTEIPVREFNGDERAARMWEIAENLHRAELTVLERSEQTAEWMRLSGEEKGSQLDQVSPVGGRGNEGGISRTSRELNIDRNEARRAAKIDSLAPEAKEAARDLGLDDNQSALLKAAKADTAEEQIKALRQRKERKQSPPREQPANLAAGADGANVEPLAPRQSVAPQFSFHDLPFDAASSMVQAWFGTLTDELKVEHATKIVGAMTREQIDEVMSGLGGDSTLVEH